MTNLSPLQHELLLLLGIYLNRRSILWVSLILDLSLLTSSLRAFVAVIHHAPFFLFTTRALLHTWIACGDTYLELSFKLRIRCAYWYTNRRQLQWRLATSNTLQPAQEFHE